MKKYLIILIVFLLMGCSNSENKHTDEPDLFGDKVFSKEEVETKINEGLSDVWEDYMINIMNYYRDGLPENFKTSLIEAVGEYKYDNYRYETNNSWKSYFYAPDDVGEKIHALLDLYGVSPDMLEKDIDRQELENKVSDNPEIDPSQYKTYEDGDAYIPYFSYFRSKVLAQNDYIRIEGPDEINVDYYEQLERVVRIRNISDVPVYIYYYLDRPDGSALSKEIYETIRNDSNYEEAYDKTAELENDVSNTFMAFYTKDILFPDEETYLRVSYSYFRDLNSHWYFKVYPCNEEDIADLYEDPVDALSIIRQQRDSEDIALILKNRVREKTENKFDYATIKGTIYDEEGKSLAFMPFRLMGFDEETGRTEDKQLFTSYDGSFVIKVPIVKYKSDETYARYIIFVDGEKRPINGKMTTMVIGDLFALNDEIVEGVKYSDYIKDIKMYGQKSVFLQPSEEKEYEVNIIVPDKFDHLIYDYSDEIDYGGQANYYDYSNGVFATVKFHDDEPGAHETAYLNVFDTDGELFFRKKLGLQTCNVCVSPDGSLVGTTIAFNENVSADFDFENPPENVGTATIFDIAGNIVFENNNGTRAMAISHDNCFVALEVKEKILGVMDIESKEIIWMDYRGEQIRHLIYSEDDSVLYMGSQECIAAYDARSGKMLWQTFTMGGFPIDMIMSSKYIYVSPKATGIDNKLICIDRKSGETVWSFQTGSRGTKLSISPDESILFWGNDTGARDVGLYMLEADTGRPLWTLNYGGQAVWFTSDSRYVVIKDYGICEVFTRDGNKIATTAVGSNSKMSWFVYIKDDLSRILNIAGGGEGGNSGWLYNLILKEGYDREFIDRQYEER